MMKTSDELKLRLAEESFAFNRKTDREYGEIFNDLFTIFMWEEEEGRQHRLKVKKRKLQQKQTTDNEIDESSLCDFNSEKSTSSSSSNSIVNSDGESSQV